MSIDQLDAALLDLLHTEPKVGVLEASRRLGVARGTVQARLDRLERTGVITSSAPTLDPEALGFPVVAFATLEIAQGNGHAAVVEHLTAIPEVLEAHTITGAGDVLVRVVARTHADLQRVINSIVDGHNVLRSSTVIATQTQIALRHDQLVRAAVPPTTVDDPHDSARAAVN
ncbi:MULTISPECIES: Lrp/AsnC family transcriptional regulator [unclassified Rhodococcus (in: high G+C Gram-positive bacteria)]|uniref:Lrp/AsnC family transcriptional regulator n=1 Tax=unclassified Rhodococcus (in: high G+C Gram-positive bacteria) TaxID=192944 RepID=UPI0016395F71|nr:MULTISPECIES: Lrp/AsnC ligand binding domain-containing protein [unclassified Rhodococcus (in: high G+C Gram-positive bacteria)]MBC2639400.1 Lrp/AsnC ligand binding domain-containing protein [Rhodococcus sp. 3A]MBC2895855.1 Lrp/AsnC ligand binding domain-containing protein [Rhodococcus sp. 4CII]